MTKRRKDEYEEALRDFSELLKQRIKEDIKFWKSQDRSHAKGREMAYSSCLFELKEALSRNGLSLGDIGLADYKVPKVDENE